MEVSRLTLSKETANQKSTKGKVLEWMLEHPIQCKGTNAMALAKAMELSGVGGTQGSLAHVIQRMVALQMINRYGNNRRASFIINYMHRDIPGYVLEKMPEDARRARANLEFQLKQNQSIDDVGCVVTTPVKPKAEPEPEPEPKPEVEPETEPEPEPKPEVEPEVEVEPEDTFETAEVITPEQPAQVEVRRESGEIKLTLTLNININS